MRIEPVGGRIEVWRKRADGQMALRMEILDDVNQSSTAKALKKMLKKQEAEQSRTMPNLAGLQCAGASIAFELAVAGVLQSVHEAFNLVCGRTRGSQHG